MTASPRIPGRSDSGGSASGWSVREVSETGSTNADLLDLVDDGVAADRLVLRTDHQTAGRGRLDRRWEAPPGSNLLMSILFLEPPDPAHTLTQAVGLAAVRAVDRLVAADRASLKWPNDVLLDGRKLAGVLAQRHATGPVVVGVGLNVGWAPDGAARLADAVAPGVVPPSPAELMTSLLDELAAVLASAGTDGASAVTAAARTRLSTIGSMVRVELPGGGVVVGRAVDVDDGGALLVVVDDGGHVHRFDVGDVVHLRPGD